MSNNGTIQRINLCMGETIAGKYRIESLLGHGGFGDVFRVSSVHGSEVYAVKMLRLWELEDDKRQQREIAERFKREFECCRIDSPRLVHAYEWGEIGGNPYFIMDYYAAGSLAGKIGTPLPLDDAERMGQEILAGLDVLHRQGIVHRDLKPENVLLDENGRLRLTDFGISGYLNARMTGRRGLEWYTYGYAAPEQINPKSAYQALGFSFDLYAFGVMLYEFITGKLPFGSPMMPVTNQQPVACYDYFDRQKKGKWDPIRQYRKDCPHILVGLIEGCLQPDPAKRIGSVEEALRRWNCAQKPGVVEEKEIVCSSCRKRIPAKPLYSCPQCGEPLGEGFGLRVMHGEERGRFYDLEKLLGGKTGSLRLGRHEAPDDPVRNHIKIMEQQDPPYVSRRHATLEKYDNKGGWLIRDGQWLPPGHFSPDGKWISEAGSWTRKASHNGTLVNSRKVEWEPVPLQPGDILTVGDTTLKAEWWKEKLLS